MTNDPKWSIYSQPKFDGIKEKWVVEVKNTDGEVISTREFSWRDEAYEFITDDDLNDLLENLP